MGGYDAFCAICGAVASGPADIQDMDEKIVRAEDMEWMDDVRIMGENPESPSLCRYSQPLQDLSATQAPLTMCIGCLFRARPATKTRGSMR